MTLMNTDEILADVYGAIDTPPDAVMIHVYVIVEYLDPKDNKLRLIRIADKDLTTWTEDGMLTYCRDRPWPASLEEDD